MMSVNLTDIAILNISLISKNTALDLVQNADLTEKSWTL